MFFYSFPNQATIRDMWLDILGLNLSQIPNGARICSAHFKEESLDRTNLSKIRLRPNALPFKAEEEREEGVSFVTCRMLKNYLFLENV